MIRDMTKGNIFLHLIFYSLPLLAGNVLNQLYNTVDSAVVGSVDGKEALAAIGAAGPVMNILLFFIVGISMGSSILMSNYYGAGKMELLKRQLMTSLIGSMILTLLLSIASFFLCPLFLKWVRTPDVLVEDASEYLKIIITGLLFSCFYNILSAGLRAVGNSRAPLYVLFLSTAVNIALDLFLVGKLKLGVRGAAYATVLSQLVSAAGSFVYLYIKIPFFRFTKKEIQMDLSLLKNTIRFSSVSAIQQTVLYVGRILVQSAVNILGVDAVAAFNISSIIDNYVLEPGNSLASSLTVFIAQNEGAGKKERLLKGFWITLCMGITISLITAILIFSRTDSFIALFLSNKDQGVIAIGYQYLRMMSFGYILTIFCNSFQGLFRGLGKLRVTLIATMVQIPVRVIITYSFIHTCGIRAVSLGMIIGWIFMIAYEGRGYIKLKNSLECDRA